MPLKGQFIFGASCMVKSVPIEFLELLAIEKPDLAITLKPVTN